MARRLSIEQLEVRYALTASISGSVWEDANGNGVRDYVETGIAGVEVFLDLNDNGVCDAGEPTMLTSSDDPLTGDVDETGTYTFGDLTPGIYLVRQTVPDQLASFPDPQSPLVVWEQLADGGLDSQGNTISGLDGVRGAVLSPDNRHLYVAAWNSSAVTVFRRDLTTGQLTFVESLRDGGQDGTGQIIDGLWAAMPIVMSASGEHVYAGGRYDNAIAWFHRDLDTGRLTFRGKVKDGQQDGAGKIVDGLDGVVSVTLSPDGNHVYATGYDEDAVAVLQRDVATGGLTYVTTYKNGQIVGGGETLDGLDGAWAVMPSGDGRHVYATGYLDDTVVVFARDRITGELTWIETLRNLQPDGSGTTVLGLNGSYSITLAPDGTEAFVAGEVDDAIARFRRDPASGRLTFGEVINNGEEAIDLDLPRSVVFAPDGDEFYVPAVNALVTFHRDPVTQRVQFEQVLSNGAQDGQGQLVGKLESARAVATTSDGQFVYVTAYDADAVTAYYRLRHPGARVVEVGVGQKYPDRDFGRRPLTGNEILYIMTEYPDRPANASETVARHYMSQANDYYIHNSYGKWSYPHITITPPLMMPHDLAWYNPEDDRQGLVSMWADAKSAALDAGYDPTASRHNFLYYDSFVYACKGLAELPGNDIRISCVAVVRMPVHEMAHNLGVPHSDHWDTGGTSIIGPGTLVSDNPFDPMGAAVLGDLLLYEKKRLGWLDDAQVPQVTDSGMYTIQAMDRGVAYDDQDYGLWIARGDGKEYWFEFRQGEASNEWSEDGIVAYWKNVLLDMTPGSPDGIDDSPLLIGRTFSDSEAGIHITPVGKHETFPESIDIVVNLGQFPGNRPPVASFSASRRNAFVGETVYFWDESVDPDEQDLANFWSFDDGTWQTNRPVAAKVWSQPGQYEVRIEVTDMHGGTATVTQTVVVESSAGPYLRVAPQAAAIPENAGTGAITATLMRGNADLDTDLTVTLASSDPSELDVPPQVTIPAGAASAVFFLQPVDDDLLDGTQTVSVTATAAGLPADTAQLAVTDHETLSLTVSPSSIAENAGLEAAWGTVTRSNTDRDLPLTVTLQCADPSEILVPATVEIPGGASAVSFPIAAVDDLLLDGTQMATIRVMASGYETGEAELSVMDDEIVKLTVTSLTPTRNGFVAQFSGDFKREGLNLYDGAEGTLGAADVVLKDGSGQSVAGTLVVAANRQAIEFVQTGEILTPSTYTVTLKSGANAFRTADDGLLDGNRDGTPGDNFTTSFTVVASSDRIVSIPDLARGAGQSVNVPNAAIGLPIRLDNAVGVTSLAVDLVYDSALLTITAASLAAGIPGDWSVVNPPDTSTPGVAKIRASGTTPLAGTDIEVVRLTAAVPGDAPYGGVQAIRLENVLLNGGAIAGIGDVAVHKAVYLGDADGSGMLSAADGFLIVQVAVGMASGFETHPWTDPRIIADVDNSGVLSSADAFLVVQEGLGKDDGHWVPDNPHIPITPVGGGGDPQFQIDVNLPAALGGVVTVPVKLDIEPAATNVGAIEFELFFDPERLTIQLPDGVSAGADTSGWAVTAKLVAPGQLRVGMVSSTGQPLALGLREIARLQFHVEAGKSRRTGCQPVPDGLPTRPTLLSPVTAVSDGSETHPTWLDIEPVDARAGGYTWTDADGSVRIRPTQRTLAGAARERLWRDLDARADLLESVLAELTHDLESAWR